VVVTSPTGGEGKSTTVANLGAVMAAAGKKVALIDADLRTPRLSTYLGLEGDRGLSTVLGGRANVLNVLQSWGDSGLQVLASGPLPVNPSELIGSTRMARVLAEMQDMFDLVIIDAPPLVPVTDAAVLSAHGSGVALLVQQNKTKQADVVAAMKILSTVDAKVLGAILNMRPAKGRGVDAYAVKVASSESRAAVGSRMLLPDDEDEVRPDSLTTIGAKPVRT
jgi:capsular exopolysaccharide synthesis family protein